MAVERLEDTDCSLRARIRHAANHLVLIKKDDFGPEDRAGRTERDEPRL
jgi:hypothetical protein